ncbi:hypothetical protein [Cryobacterium sp. Y62]|uniref:hypothetical protein n=1 Tax=Cryobacterium sp. Y62 TaxID=2048284 RepID=UPI000CE378B8|nr:hypothetical protein [Cryobacterium sp. Y62]
MAEFSTTERSIEGVLQMSWSGKIAGILAKGLNQNVVDGKLLDAGKDLEKVINEMIDARLKDK